MVAPLFGDLMSPKQEPARANRLRSCDITFALTFASGVATVVNPSHSGITCTRQSTTGIYDLVLPPASAYHFHMPVFQDTSDDAAANARFADFGVNDPSAGTCEIRFLATGVAAAPDLDDLAPANTSTVYVTITAYSA